MPAAFPQCPGDKDRPDADTQTPTVSETKHAADSHRNPDLTLRAYVGLTHPRVTGIRGQTGTHTDAGNTKADTDTHIHKYSPRQTATEECILISRWLTRIDLLRRTVEFRHPHWTQPSY